MKKIFLLWFCCCLFAFTNEQTASTIKIDLITKIPTAIDGCSGLYTYDSISLKKNRYILITDIQTIGFIKINGKEIKLKLISQKELSAVSNRMIFKGSGYTVTLNTRSGKQIDEVLSETGTLEIMYGQAKLIIKIHGESGC